MQGAREWDVMKVTSMTEGRDVTVTTERDYTP